MEVAGAVQRYKMLNSFVGQVLREGTDYGKIPGTGDKSTLLKPGAEKLAMFFGLSPTFEHVRVIEDWTGAEHNGEPFFYYLVKCRMLRGGVVVAEADGSCNSWESKFRYRQGERVCPECGKATIIKGREEYGGGWICFAKKGGCGAKFKDGDKTITEQQTGRVLNPDPADQVNTILKQAEKRALVAATLIAVNASDYFTQDIEDLPGFGEVVQASVRIVEQQPTGATGSTPEEPASDAEFRKMTEDRATAPNTPRLAVNKAGADFGKFATTFAGKHPAWQNKVGNFDFEHICASAAEVGYAEITRENIIEVFNKLEARALSKEADAAAGK